jgi:hypothetical protein
MTRLVDILEKFRAAHLLVVGDLMLDRFIWGDVERISPEAPVPVMRVLGGESSPRWGGQRHKQRSYVGSSCDRLWDHRTGYGGETASS